MSLDVTKVIILLTCVNKYYNNINYVIICYVLLYAGTEVVCNAENLEGTRYSSFKYLKNFAYIFVGPLINKYRL